MNFDEKNSKKEIIWQDPNHRTNMESEQNQAVQQTTSEVQKFCAYPHTQNIYHSPYYANEWGALNNPIAMAGVSQEQAQELNYLRMKNQLELMRRQVELHMQFQHQYDLQMLKNANKLPPEENVPITSPKIVSDQYVTDFIQNMRIIKIRSSASRSGWKYLMRDKHLNRHIPIIETNLSAMFQDWLYEKIGNAVDEISGKDFERCIRTLQRSIKELEDSDLRTLSTTQLKFQNGVYDFQNGKFDFYSNQEIFSTFSILQNYATDSPEPVAFNALLDDMTGNDEELKQLIYEIIGAVLSNVTLLKKIFVFQGVSNGGKTRLMNIIADLLDEDDVKFVGNISDVTSENFQKHLGNRHLICINDAANKQMGSVQVSCLKSFADGNIQRTGNVTKLILATNHKVFSQSDGTLEPALLNRFQVIPFKKSMANIDENVAMFEEYFFETEKEGIIRKALEAFHNVIKNDRQFCCSPKINEYVVQAINTYTDTEREIVNKIKKDCKPFTNTPKQKLQELLGDLFILTDECNKNMSLENILKTIRNIDSTLVTNSNQMGKDLKTFFGENLKMERFNNATYYNLNYKSNE